MHPYIPQAQPYAYPQAAWSPRPSAPGSAVTALAMVATGRADGYWGPTVRVWDVAAGVLLVREAGGVVGDLSGPHDGPGTPPSGQLLASSAELFTPLRELIAPVYAG